MEASRKMEVYNWVQTVDTDMDLDFGVQGLGLADNDLYF